MTINEWQKDFKSFINELQMPRDDYKGIMLYIDEGAELLKALKQRGLKLGRWKQVPGMITPGGTPYFECGSCGGTGHLHGCEYPKRKMICDVCGAVNIYPWESAYEKGSSLWEAVD